MEVERGDKVGLAGGVAADDQKFLRSIGKEGLGVFHAARGAQRLILAEISQLHAGVFGAAGRLELVGQVSRGQRGFLDAVVREQFDYSEYDRLARDGNERFGAACPLLGAVGCPTRPP